jgi:hypothetical protein
MRQIPDTRTVVAHTLWDERDRRALDDRLARLTPDARGLWGSFDAPRMLCHITDTVRFATGDLACALKPSPFRYPPINTLVMFYLPWPKGVPTAPELIARTPEAWDTEVARFRAAVDALTKRPKDGAWPVHVVFGRLSGSQWGRLLYRHTDHHLKQFGV